MYYRRNKSKKQVLFIDIVMFLLFCDQIRDARYTGTVKLPVFIIFQTVRYHNFAYNSVFHTLLF